MLYVDYDPSRNPADPPAPPDPQPCSEVPAKHEDEPVDEQDD